MTHMTPQKPHSLPGTFSRSQCAYVNAKPILSLQTSHVQHACAAMRLLLPMPSCQSDWQTRRLVGRYNGRQTHDGRLEASGSPPSSAPSTPAMRTLNDRRHSSHADQQPAVSRAWQTQPKPKGQSLGLMLEGTRVARVMRGSPAHAAGLVTAPPPPPLIFPLCLSSLPAAYVLVHRDARSRVVLHCHLTSPTHQHTRPSTRRPCQAGQWHPGGERRRGQNIAHAVAWRRRAPRTCCRPRYGLVTWRRHAHEFAFVRVFCFLSPAADVVGHPAQETRRYASSCSPRTWRSRTAAPRRPCRRRRTAMRRWPGRFMRMRPPCWPWK